jgi:orotidine-5'-phosphate decarboxylase
MSTSLPIRLCLALDGMDAYVATKRVVSMQEVVPVFKVGHELLPDPYLMGLVNTIVRGSQLFADVKLFDVAKTVRAAARRWQDAGASYLTVYHREDLVGAAREGFNGTLLTVPSLTDRPEPVSGHQLYHALQWGASGVVCGVPEAKFLRFAEPEAFIACVGLHLRGETPVEQVRHGTPYQVRDARADMAIVGSSITLCHAPVSRALTYRGILDNPDGP